MSRKGAVAACLIGLFVTAFVIFSFILLCNRRKALQTSPRWFPEWVPNWFKNQFNGGRARLDSIDDAWNQSLVATQVQDDEEEYTVEFQKYNEQQGAPVVIAK